MFNTSLSGDELFCLAQKGYQARKMVIGTSIYSQGLIEMLGAGYKPTLGKELHSATEVSAAGWEKAYQKLMTEVQAVEGASLISLDCFPRSYSGYREFLMTGSLIQAVDQKQQPFFTAASDGQALYAQLDAGYQPRRFVWGNAVYSMGLSQSLRNSFKAFAQGRMTEFSALLSETRYRVLEQLKAKAKESQANAIVGIKTLIFPFGKACELLMIGTACFQPELQALASAEPVTSGLSAVETWNLARMGYVPLGLVSTTTVYSLGLRGSALSGVKAFFRGDIQELSSLMGEAREQALASLQEEASKIGAEGIVNTKLGVYSLGNGLMDFWAMGTAIKKCPTKTQSEQLPPQAWVSNESNFYHGIGNINKGSPFSGMWRLLLVGVIIIFLVWLAWK